MESSSKKSDFAAEHHQKAVLLQQALSKASALCAQKKKQLSMCSVDAKGSADGECSSTQNGFSTICDSNRPGSSHSFCDTDEKTSEQEAHMVLIRQHKLYPVLELMLKKCELATWNMSKDVFSMDDVCDLFAELEEDGDSIRSDNEELDSLLVNAILMLRIHLIELSKVFDLCTDFKLKYIQSLKKKMSQETMIGLSGDSDEEAGSPTGPLEFTDQRFITDLHARNSTLAMLATANGMVTIPLSFFNSSTIHTPPSCSSTAINNTAATKPPLYVHQDAKSKAKDAEKSSSRFNEKLGDGRPQSQQCTEDDDRNELKRKLPTRAVDILKSWFHQHNSHPYPTDNEKAELSKETGLHITQINNWFINARRRIVTNKTTNSSGRDSAEATEVAHDWSPTLKKRRKDSKNGQSSYTIESFFSDDRKASKFGD